MVVVVLAAATITGVSTQERPRSFGLLSSPERLEAMRRL
jgi:hypothetical protein